jgi:hypothetical protein
MLKDDDDGARALHRVVPLRQQGAHGVAARGARRRRVIPAAPAQHWQRARAGQCVTAVCLIDCTSPTSSSLPPSIECAEAQAPLEAMPPWRLRGCARQPLRTALTHALSAVA